MKKERAIMEEITRELMKQPFETNLYSFNQSTMPAVGLPIGDIIPIQVRKLADLILAFAGNSPASKKFEKTQETYIQTLATQIALVELTPIKENETN